MTGKLHIFVSYARADGSEFAASLVAALEAAGFDPFLDRQDIVPGEPWEDRLSRLLQEADTLVYVITPASIRSERCSWEIDQARKLAKRIIPVVASEVAVEDMPASLQRLNLVFFTRDLSFGQALKQLSEALRTNLDWVREHTRLSDLASQWKAQSQQDEWLLRGEQLAAAKQWLSDWTSGAPETTDLQRAFIQASAEAEDARNNEERRQLAAMAEAQAEREKALRSAARSNRLALIVTGLLVVAMGGLGVLAYSFWQDGVEARAAARAAEEAAELAQANNEELASSIDAMREQIAMYSAGKSDGVVLDRGALDSILETQPDRSAGAGGGYADDYEDLALEEKSFEPPAPSAPGTSAPAPAPEAGEAAAQVALSGWNIDIFWCEGAGSAVRQAEAEAIAASLTSAAAPQAGSLPIGRVRARALSEATNARSGYDVRTNQIRAEAQESEEARELEAFISGTATAPFTNVTSRTRTYQYLSVFICAGAKGAS